jgi:hypothetical protein
MTLDKLESQVIALNGGASGNPSSAINTNSILDHQSNTNNNNHLEEQNCLLEGSRGVNYRGIQSITRNGLMCQKWNPQIMRSNYMNMASEEILNELSGHNYCRNIDNDIDGPWCYTTNPRMPKDYCNIPSCDSINNNNNELIKTASQPTLDKSFMKESRLIIGVSVSFLVVIVFILIMFCMCRSRGNSTPTGTASNQHLIMHKNSEKQQQQSITSSVNGMPILSNMSGGTCASSGASQIHPSRLRMSNVSLGNKKQSSLNKNHRGGSSKSSVASSSTNNNNNQQQQQNILNMEVNNPFIKNNNYDNQQNIFNYQQQQMQIHHQVPQFQIQQIQQQQMQQQFQQQHHHQQHLQQQAPQANNDCDFSVKQFSANNLRLLQEIGKGNIF